MKVAEDHAKDGTITVKPVFLARRSSDFMARGKDFYAIWNPATGLWCTDEYEALQLIDNELWNYANELKQKTVAPVRVSSVTNFTSGSFKDFKSYVKLLADSNVQLDNKIIFANDKTKKEDYASKRLPYPLKKGKIKNYDTIISTLYDPDERAKLEWAIGSIFSGDSKTIQKFIVLYGDAGAGKSTILNIIQKLFEGYYSIFESTELGNRNASFAMEAFASNPLVSIQHDGDLSRIEDNTKINSIVSHEEMVINQKFKAKYSIKLNTFLFMATNKPVKITDAKSGIIRRLIDVKPSGRKLEPQKYQNCMDQIDFELGAIANHCLTVYREMGKHYYDSYVPFQMVEQTDVFFNFVDENYDIFSEQEYITLKQAYAMYRDYCEETKLEYVMPQYRFREELKNYFRNFEKRYRESDKQMRSVYSGFRTEKFLEREPILPGPIKVLALEYTTSILDNILADCPAQYAKEDGTPQTRWSKVTTKLKDLDTSKIHYIQVPKEHIVIDFDLKNDAGEKDAVKNLQAAYNFPPTYAEYSKGGAGVHLHYIYEGDVDKLASVYSEGIEIKVFKGNSALRRRFSKCNNLPIAHISSGLPLKGEKAVIDFKVTYNENAIRTIIQKNLNKEYHPGTKPSIDFIYDTLEQAYAMGLEYDVTDMRAKVLNFATKSSNQAGYCIKLVNKMKFKSETQREEATLVENDDKLVFYDVEVFPNLFLVNWKYEGANQCVRMINPTPADIEDLMKKKLVGFNCRRYDNHILYGAYLGYNNLELYKLSQAIVVKKDKDAFFREAYNISYTDVYDFCNIKKSLKKWEIALGIHHMELGLPWDEPVPEEKWEKVAEYCDNDVFSTEAVFVHNNADWTARKLLAKLSGLSTNATTQQHAAKIIFKGDNNPQSKFIYTHLDEMFPGYKFEAGVSTYMGEEVGEGGRVYAEPGMYYNVALLDVESMHPTSLEELNAFGEYTKNFSEIKAARLAIKHEELDKLTDLLDGELDKLMKEDPTVTPEDLSYALKIIINIVYGLTSAKFSNPFKDPRNIDNIVAKRGALFMMDLEKAVKEKGYTVAHIKTDSIKIPNADKEIIEFVMEFGKKYGYKFEHEATYERMCLVNDAVYIARYQNPDWCMERYGYVPKNCKKHADEWTATGTQFAVPYVFKSLFSHEEITFDDMCVTKEVKSAAGMYLDMNEGMEEGEHNYIFIGRVGLFSPVKPGCGGGWLLDKRADDKFYAVTGTKDYRWQEVEVIKNLNKESDVDISYFDSLVNDAIEKINEFGDFVDFVEN